MAPDELGRVARALSGIFADRGYSIPLDPLTQIRRPFLRFLAHGTATARKPIGALRGFLDDLFTAANVQMMAFGNLGDQSGTGVAFFTKPVPTALSIPPMGDFLQRAQGEDVVAGTHQTLRSQLCENFGQTCMPSSERTAHLLNMIYAIWSTSSLQLNLENSGCCNIAGASAARVRRFAWLSTWPKIQSSRSRVKKPFGALRKSFSIRRCCLLRNSTQPICACWPLAWQRLPDKRSARYAPALMRLSQRKGAARRSFWRVVKRLRRISRAWQLQSEFSRRVVGMSAMPPSSRAGGACQRSLVRKRWKCWTRVSESRTS